MKLPNFGLCSRISSIVLLSAITGCSTLPPIKNSFQLASISNPQDEFRRGSITDKESAEACIAIAENFEESGHLDAAVTQYERARKQDKDQINYSRRLAVLYARLGRRPDAQREFELAISESPKDIDLKNDYAYFLTESGDTSGGEKILREILTQTPTHQRAAINLGINLTYQDRLAEAHAAFTKAVDSSSAHHNIGVVLAKRGLHAKAANAFQQANVKSVR